MSRVTPDKLQARIKRLRRAIRELTKGYEFRTRTLEALLAKSRLWQKEREDYFRAIDYRSVCRCVPCAFREWYRYRSGEIYPAQCHPRYRYGWRLPLAGRWPLWR